MLTGASSMRRLYLVLSFSGSNNATLVLNRCELPKASKVVNSLEEFLTRLLLVGTTPETTNTNL